MALLASYLPVDRRHALLSGRALPERATGVALFADISGFTPATALFARVRGPQRGAEELLALLNAIYTDLIAEVDRFGGSVIGFSGDAVTCWFDAAAPLAGAGEPSATLRAAACALAMQAAMGPYLQVAVPGGHELALGLKTSVAAGPVRRLLVGDPAVQLIEALAGATIVRLGAVAAQTRTGETLLDAAAAGLLASQGPIGPWRELPGGGRAAPLGGLGGPVAPAPWPPLSADALEDDTLRPWVLPPVYERLRGGQGAFLSDLRHTTALFLRFADFDYDRDEGAVPRLDRLVRWVQGELARHEGWLIQLSMGDKGSYLHVCFGAPVAHPDDAARAAAAALALRRPPPDLAAAAPLQIGICGGQARTGDMGGGTRTYNVMGDATNVAARLMEAAAPGQALISASLAPALGRRFLLEQLPPISVKGIQAPVAIVALAGRRDEHQMALAEPQYGLTMIGRDPELAEIAAAIGRARDGQGGLLAITGEAGIGKSRLVAETIRRAEAAGFVGFGGAAQATATQAAYAAWRPIWRALLGLDAAAPPEAQATALAAALAALDGGLLPRLPLLGPLLDLPLPESELTRGLETSQRKAALEALLVECLRLRLRPGGGYRAPLLIVLEDIHWLDGLSRDLLAAVARAVAELPLLLVVAARPPELDAGAPALAAWLPQAQELPVGELPPAAAAELARRRVALAFDGAEPDEALVAAILARAEGNPFYIEELINFLRDRGMALADAVAARIELPASLAGLILSRVDQLGAERQITLKVASVIGRVFAMEWLWGVYPGLGPAARVRADLEALSRLDVTPLHTPEPSLHFMFKHATTQEAIYGSLPFAQRAELHGQLAAWLEARPETAGQLDLLAYHYGRSGLAAKQREYFRRAGDAAAARFANTAAIQYYEQLLGLLAPAEQAPVLVAIGRIHELMSAWALAEARYREALAAAEAAGDLPTLAKAQAGLGNSFWGRGGYDEGLPWLERARATLAALGDRAGLSETLLQMSRGRWFQGQFEQARTYADQALALEGPDGDRRRRGLGLHMLGMVALSLRDFPQAASWFEQSLPQRRAAGDLQGAAHTLSNMATLAYLGGRYDEAWRLFSESAPIFRDIGAGWEHGLARVFLALVATSRGDPAAAQLMLVDSLRYLREQGSGPIVDLGLIGLAQATLQAETGEEAGRFAVSLLAAADILNITFNSKRQAIYQALADAALAEARRQLPEAAFAEAWEAGGALHWTEAITLATARFAGRGEP
jgi:adenylate cyclase